MLHTYTRHHNNKNVCDKAKTWLFPCAYWTYKGTQTPKKRIVLDKTLAKRKLLDYVQHRKQKQKQS